MHSAPVAGMPGVRAGCSEKGAIDALLNLLQTAEKMKDACEKAGYNFPFVEILKWYKN